MRKGLHNLEYPTWNTLGCTGHPMVTAETG